MVVGGCVHGLPVNDRPTAQVPYHFDQVKLGMSKQRVLEVLGIAQAQTSNGRFRWEYRPNEETEDYLEVGFDVNEVVIYIQDSRTRRRSYRT